VKARKQKLIYSLDAYRVPNLIPISGHQQSRGYEDGLWKGSEPPLLVAADFYKEFFDLCFIASVGFDDHLIDLLFASILLAPASFCGGCSSGAY
jgi:hypothetical protein